MGAAFERFTEALRTQGWKTKPSGRERLVAQCPAHRGEDLNLAVAAGDQGVLVACHSHGCSAVDIAAALGLKLDDLFDNRRGTDYDYGNGHHVRRVRTAKGKGKAIFQAGAPQGATSLYRHPASEPLESPSGHILIVEGEKCVDIALRMGEKCVTTWPMGAGAVDRVDLSPLSGKTIRIIADNDEQGHRAAAKLVHRLGGLATVEGVWIVLGEGNDVEHLYMNDRPLSDLIPFDVSAAIAELEQNAAEPEPDRMLDITSMEDIEVEPLRFLWADKIPSRGVTLMAGRGGVAKSTFALYLAGLITRGQLQGDLYGEPQTVLYVSHEDSLSQVVKPRAIANNVDLSRLKILGIRVRELGDLTVVPNLPQDMPLLRKGIEDSGAKVIIIDPITSTLGGDNDKMADVRQVMNPLTALCEELGITVLAIAHFRKGSGHASDMISGSHAWRDTARASLLFAKEEGDAVADGDVPRTIITLDKANYAKDGQSFAYHVEEFHVPNREGTQTRTTRVIWDGESEVTVSQLINAGEQPRQGRLANDLVDFIRSFDGRAVSTKDILAHFATSDVKPNTVKQNLSRIVKRGLVESPEWGHYQAKVAPHARVGVSQLSPVSPIPGIGTKVTEMTEVTPPHVRAREDEPEEGICTACGGRLSAMAVAAGEVRHDVC